MMVFVMEVVEDLVNFVVEVVVEVEVEVGLIDGGSMVIYALRIVENVMTGKKYVLCHSMSSSLGAPNTQRVCRMEY